MKIGELAKRAGVNIQTIRFYERQRLLREPSRSASGYRSYAQSDLEALRFIRDAQQLGFTLRDIQQLTELHRAFSPPRASRMDPAHVEELVTLTKQRLRLIDQKVRMLQVMQSQLATSVRHYQRSRKLTCPASPKRP
jgi:MerR family mercuric resistance operon transcriptional regulator